MARLFITPREIDFINDINKELIKDVVGQKLYYYAIRRNVTDVHDVYEEAVEKAFDPPLELEARIEYQPDLTTVTRHGVDDVATINVFLQYRDLVDRDIDVKVGEYFSYGNRFYEIINVAFETVIYGQIEHMMSVKMTGKKARLGQTDKDALGPTAEQYTDPGSIQETFVQQRGFEENRLGKTEEVPALQEIGVLDAPISGTAEVSKLGDESGITSSFYDET